MVKMIRQVTLEDKDEVERLTASQIYWAYNGMDCMVTAEIEEQLRSQLDAETGWIYQFEMAQLAPAMEMALRGLKVDFFARDDMTRKLEKEQAILGDILLEYGRALGFDKGIKENSPKQLKDLFYDVLELPKQHRYDRQKREEVVSVDREALEKLSKFHVANPICKAILAQRDRGKKLSVLRSGVDRDGRMRFSFNVGGTETGRWSSSKNVFGGGMNAQNITEEIRHIFVASPGKKLAYIDLEQAESRAVAFLSGDEAYRNACESGDLHTTVTRLIWPKLDWSPSRNLDHDKGVAERQFYRQFSYRDMAKRGGHGSNYLGTPPTMAKHLKIDVALMRDFQAGYFRAFPGIPAWHGATATRLQSTGYLTTPFGRRRAFLGRLGEPATLREAVAYCPQSLIADYMNAGVCRLWTWGKVSLLAQVHDAVLFEYDEDRDDLVLEAARILSQSIKLFDGRDFQVPCEPAVGWNWGKVGKDGSNPYGLKKLKGKDLRDSPNVQSANGILARRFQ
jgi:DNA polymerase I